MHQICDWARYHNRHIFKKYMSDQAVLLRKIDPTMGESVWQNNRLVTHILFEPIMPIMIFSPVANLMHHPICSYNSWDTDNHVSFPVSGFFSKKTVFMRTCDIVLLRK